MAGGLCAHTSTSRYRVCMTMVLRIISRIMTVDEHHLSGALIQGILVPPPPPSHRTNIYNWSAYLMEHLTKSKAFRILQYYGPHQRFLYDYDFCTIRLFVRFSSKFEMKKRVARLESRNYFVWLFCLLETEMAWTVTLNTSLLKIIDAGLLFTCRSQMVAGNLQKNIRDG